MERIIREENLYNKRSFHHNYFKPFIYHIIFKKKKGFNDFGVLRGIAGTRKGCKGAPYVYLSPSGNAIVKGLRDFEGHVPEIQKFHYKIMPDHIHMIIFKKIYTPVHLDDYMDNLKEMIADHYSKSIGSIVKKEDIFVEGYTDKPLYDDVVLSNWYDYIDDNPNRRLTIIQKPDFFKRIHNLEIEGSRYEAYGNIFLWRNPDKYAVRMRSCFTSDKRLEHKEEALYMASKGTVLVSPFISPDEKTVKEESEQRGFPYILIQHNSFGEKFKPPKHQFELCASGKLLIISMGMDPKMSISHDICTQMNDLASKIVGRLPSLP